MAKCRERQRKGNEKEKEREKKEKKGEENNMGLSTRWPILYKDRGLQHFYIN